MTRFLAPLAFAVTIAASAALAQTPAAVHSATINNVKVSGVVATSTNNGAAGHSLDSVTNLLDNFSDAQPAIPVLTPPASLAQPGATKDCVGPNC
ncbi:MAG TPA: hypothetical protein VGR70_07790 [Stellaceae bacterium]|nr:hypothetical protein [Stellaceae bacterium]